MSEKKTKNIKKCNFEEIKPEKPNFAEKIKKSLCMNECNSRRLYEYKIAY